MPTRTDLAMAAAFVAFLVTLFAGVCLQVWLICRIYDHVTKGERMKRGHDESSDQSAIEEGLGYLDGKPTIAVPRTPYPSNVHLGDLFEGEGEYNRAQRVADPIFYNSPNGEMSKEERAAYIAVEEYRKRNPEASDDLACRKVHVELAVYVDAKRKAIATTKEAFECPEGDLLRPDRPRGKKVNVVSPATAAGIQRVQEYLEWYPDIGVVEACRAVGVNYGTYKQARRDLRRGRPPRKHRAERTTADV